MRIYPAFTSELAVIWQQTWEASDQPLPFLTFDWHQLYASTFTAEGVPLILFDEETGVIGSFLRSADMITFNGGGEIADYLDVIGPEAAKPLFWTKALAEFSQLGVNHFRFRNVPEQSSTLAYFQNQAANQFAIKQEDTTPLFSLPIDWETYVSSLPRSDRHELRRKLRKFERENESIEVVRLEPTVGMETLLRLMRLDPAKITFLTSPMDIFFQQLPSITSGCIRIHALLVNKIPVAAIVGFVCHQQYLLYNSGYDPRFPLAGLYLVAKSIELAINEKLSIYNFLQGNEHYKYELGGQDSLVYEVRNKTI